MDQVLKVSKRIWNAMHEIDIETLNELVHEDAKFVHMGVTLSHKDEIEVIKNKKIIYKNINFEQIDLTQIESTIILLRKLKLTAVVDGNEVVNPFVVTEVYTLNDDVIKMASMSYTIINY